MEVSNVEKENKYPYPPTTTIAVAASGKRDSKLALRWALENFVSDGRRIVFKILHIRPRIMAVPSLMGPIPISTVRKDVASTYIEEVESKTNEMLAPYERLCAQRKVEVETLVIEADDIVAAISAEVSKSGINKLVVGSSPRNALSRKFLENETSATDLNWEPYFCVVYFVSKGKLSAVHTASLALSKVAEFERSRTSVSFNSFSSYASARQTGAGLFTPPLLSPSLVDQRYRALLTVNQYNNCQLGSGIDITDSGTPQVRDEKESVSIDSGHVEMHEENNSAYDSRNFQGNNHSGASDQISISDVLTDSSCTNSHVISDELEKLRIELQNVQEMFKKAPEEKSDTSVKLADHSNRKTKEDNELKLISKKKEKARELAKCEKEKHEASEEEAEFAKECLGRESIQKKEAEVIAAHEAEEKHKLESTCAYLGQQFEKFEWEEICSATSLFSDSLRVGEGAYGAVYKCTLRHITVAVKVLKAIEIQKDLQFQRELEILSRIRHPHLLMLIGACPDYGCLVYEYMENGSLDDRLRRKNGTPPISWFDRFRIVWEVASALLFLHSSKPQPVVHRDLKPANILLDHNLVSKIGDVGLCTLIPTDHSTMATVYKNTALVGTYCYVDPEYQRTGLVSPKSDLFAYGIVILQLLTGKPPMGLVHLVEKAIEEGHLEEILDQHAGKWPIKEAKELAYLGLSCAEFRHKDRPDLKDGILPALVKLKEIANREKYSKPNKHGPPSHFLCPILQDIMEDPWVAPDGYTYERRAIERWLRSHDTSPMTNLPLPNKNLIPNRTLSSAISEWKSRNQ